MSPVRISDLPDFQGLNVNQLSQAAPIGRGQDFRLGGFDADAFSADRGRVEQAQFDRSMALMNPEFELQEERLQQRLANQGLPQASRAYGAEAGRFEDTRNRAMQEAAWQAVAAGGAEQSRMMADLLAGNQAAFGQALAQRQQLGQEQLAQAGLSAQQRAQILGERQAHQAQQSAARAQLAQEQVMQRQIPLNEILAALGLSQVQMPQGYAPAPVQIPGQPGSAGIMPSLFTLGGGALGAMLGGPAGAMAGASIGSGLIR